MVIPRGLYTGNFTVSQFLRVVTFQLVVAGVLIAVAVEAGQLDALRQWSKLGK